MEVKWVVWNYARSNESARYMIMRGTVMQGKGIAGSTFRMYHIFVIAGCEIW